MIEIKTSHRSKIARRKAVKLRIRARTIAPDTWLELSGLDLRRRLVTTGSQFRSTVHDVLGRQSTRGLKKRWAKSERWKELDDVRSKWPRNRLRHLDDLLSPFIERERLEVEVMSKSGVWIPLSDAVEELRLVV